MNVRDKDNSSDTDKRQKQQINTGKALASALGVSILAVAVLSVAMLGSPSFLNGGNHVAMAQQQQSTGNATTISNATTVNTFTAKGAIGGMISEGGSSGGAGNSSSGYILAGDWKMDVKQGNVTDFLANFTMVRPDGSEHHSHTITNFQSGNNTTFQYDPNKKTTVNGVADIMVNGTSKWPGTDTTISIQKLVLSIQPTEQEAKQHFKGQPIYGVITSITGENGTQIASSIPAGGNQTQQQQQQGGGNILDQITKPFSGLFGNNNNNSSK